MLNHQGIWKYAQQMRPHVSEEFRLSIGEGKTPLERNEFLKKELNVEQISIKREDKNPTGSHKDRGLCFQISVHLQNGKKIFAISSSGNSAISAIKILQDREEKLNVFLSNKTSQEKLKRLQKLIPNFQNTDFEFKNLTFHFTPKPLSSAFKYSKENKAVLLRGSTDQYGYEGFKTISYEVEDYDFDSIFIPTSSGTTAKGIYEGLKEIRPLHIIQTTKINTLIRKFSQDKNNTKTSLATSIVDKIGHRLEEIEDLIKKSNGMGWAINDREILQAQALLKSANIKTSNESALTIAAIQKAKKEGYKIKKPLCIFTGIK